MKKYVWMIAVLMTGMSSISAYADDDIKSQDLFKQEIDLTRSALEAQRKAVIIEGLQLTAEEEVGFWKVYNAYRLDMQKAMDLRVAVIADYADAYSSDSLTDKAALDLLKRYFKSMKSQLGVKKSFVKKFKKVLSGKNIARFYQIDHRLDLLVNLQIARGVPLVEQ